MKVITKFETGGLVYIIQPYRVRYGGEVVTHEKKCIGKTEKHNRAFARSEVLYAVSPHRVLEIKISKRKDEEMMVRYRLTDGVISTEKNVFGTFEDAAGCAAKLYRNIGGQTRG